MLHLRSDRPPLSGRWTDRNRHLRRRFTDYEVRDMRDAAARLDPRLTLAARAHRIREQFGAVDVSAITIAALLRRDSYADVA